MANPALSRALKEHRQVGDAYIASLKEHGLAFAEAGSDDAAIAPLRKQLAEAGAQFLNAGASILYGWQSPACVECTGNNGSETFSTTFKCHRDCYFCFNYNVADYERFVRDDCPWEEGLAASKEQFDGLAAIGLTGGEPLLVLDQSLEFLRRAREEYPAAHLRMYTSGDLLTEEGAVRLREAGLDEIRFSVKQDDPPEQQQRVLDAMALARQHIPSVMVEMPVIPGTRDRMEELMEAWDSIGIDGVNLLEFCFPFNNWEEYASRGFLLRNPPFDVMYDYGYSGGLPVAGSEQLALELMLHGIQSGVSYGMHYCSLDNKHRSEMRQRNERGANLHPCYSFDEGDFFLKCGKVFGCDIDPAFDALREAGCESFLDLPEEESLCFPLSYLGALEETAVTPAVSFNVLQQDEMGLALQETALHLTDWR